MRLAQISVNRSEHQTVNKLVGAWEIPVLQYEYGPEKIEILGYKRDKRLYPDPGSEFERLTLRYGVDVENGQTKAALAYGQGAMGVMAIRNLMDEQKKLEEAEGDSLEFVNTVQNVVVDEERIREAKEANKLAEAEAAKAAGADKGTDVLVAQLMEQNKLLMQLLATAQAAQAVGVNGYVAQNVPVAEVAADAPAPQSKTLGLPAKKTAA